jgi:hypothetical protein
VALECADDVAAMNAANAQVIAATPPITIRRRVAIRARTAARPCVARARTVSRSGSEVSDDMT